MSVRLSVREPTPEDFIRACQTASDSGGDGPRIVPTKLAPGDVSKLLARADPIEGSEDDKKEFFKREKTLPAPRTGDMIDVPFPPEVKLEKPAELLKEEEEIRRELKVIRTMPEKADLEAVPAVVVTFNQPMVPVTGVDELKKLPVPVKMEPPVEGEWRWVSTKCVKWKPTHRLPKSTEYKITVPRGVRSEWGCELPAEVSFGFSTKTLLIKDSYPNSKHFNPPKVGPHLPVVFIEFNQRVDQSHILEKLEVRSGSGSIMHKVRGLSKFEVQELIDAHEGVMKKKRRAHYDNYKSRLSESTIRDHFVWFTFVDSLPLATGFSVVVPAGTKSAEGPRPSGTLTFSFETYGPLAIRDRYPKQADRILPLQQWTINFTNNIELDDFDPLLHVRIEPEVDGVSVSPSGASITIRGRTKGRVKYAVTFDAGLPDVYGQKLGRDSVLYFSVGPARQTLSGFHNNRVVVHDVTMNGDDPTFSIVSCNLAKAHVVVFQVRPVEHHRSGFGRDYYHYSRDWQGYGHDLKPSQYVNCGKIVADLVVPLTGNPDELSETLFHLRPHLQHPDAVLGQVVVYVEPDRASWRGEGEWRHRTRIRTWIQVTKLAVDAFASTSASLYMFASNLADGSAVADCDFSVVPPRGSLAGSSGGYEDKKLSVAGGKDGMGFLGSYSGNTNLVIGSKGDDTSFVTDVTRYPSVVGRPLCYVINDRNLYKPKETVNIKGIIRKLRYEGWQKVLDVHGGVTLRWEAFDARSAKFLNGTVKTNEHGCFKLEIVLPDNINLGEGHVKFRASSINIRHTFQVQEFRTPEFSASSSVPAGPYVVNGIAVVTGKSEYYSGGGMQGCQAQWECTQKATTYTPPGFSFNGFQFGCRYRSLNPPVVPSGAAPSAVSGGDPRAGEKKRLIRLMKMREMVARRKAEELALARLGRRRRMPRRVPDDVIVAAAGAGGPLKLEGKTNAQGEHKLCVDFKDEPILEVKCPVLITTKVNVQDINRQMMGSSSTFIVHPSKLYCGLKLKKSYCKVGDPLPLDVVVTDIDGQVVADVNVELKVICRYSERKGYRWVETEEVVDVVKFPSEGEPKELTLRLEDGGRYFLVGKIVDDGGLANFASQSIYVSGGTRGPKGGSRIQCESVQLIAGKKKFSPGDIAKVLVTAPFDAPAEGILYVLCNGFAEKQRFHMAERSQVVEVPIRKEYIPGVTIQVNLTGQTERMDELSGRPSSLAPKRPAFAQGSLHLAVPATAMTINCEVTPEKAMLKPGESSSVSVKLSCPSESFQAESSLVSVIIVDEAVLSLTGYSLPHPIETFHVANSTTIQSICLRASVVMKDWSSISVQAPVEKVRDTKPRSGFGCCWKKKGKGRRRSGRRQERECQKRSSLSECRERKEAECRRSEESRKKRCCEERRRCEPEAEVAEVAAEEPEAGIEVRTNFNPLACFIHDVVVGKDGVAVVPFTLPDNLTRYRVWALAMKGSEFYGVGESAIQAQMPIAVRPSLPRFLNFGDVAEFCCVIQNQTVGPVTVDIAVRMTNLSLIDPTSQGVQVTIPYTRRAELRFPVRTEKCGTARFQVVAAVKGTPFADAVEESLPVFTPSTSEAFATYGEVDGDGVVMQAILPPADIYNQFGGLSVTTSSTALQALTDAFLYLVRYQFDCVEQASSRMLSICSLQDILYAFNVPQMPSKAELEKIVKTGVTKIKRVQRSDGAIGFWTITSDVNIYLSIFAAHALLRAMLQGYDVDRTSLNRGKSFCQNVKVYLDRYCHWYGPYTRASVRSFALYVLALFAINGKLSASEKGMVVSQGEQLHGSLEKFLTHEGKVWLVLALWTCSPKKANHPLVKQILHWIGNNVNETPETANFITSYGDDGKLVMLHSNRRTDGVILEVLIHVDPKNYLIPKIVKGLLAHRKKGRWGSTQENVYILLALKRYFAVYEKLVPDFIARIWLGEDYCGEVEFHGRETDYKTIRVPMNVLLPDADKPGEKKDLVLWKKGAGRLYYRLGMDYAPKSLDLKPLDYGFIVHREYEAVTDPSHVTKDPDSGVWTFKAGELIRVKLRLTNVSRRYHVALVDFIPAGCEVLNPDLRGGQQLPADVKASTGSGSSGGGSPYRWSWWMYYRKWYEHVNRRDERVEAFASYLYNGVHEFDYIMSATSIGQFVVPPAKAEEMYAPELFGRSASEKVIVRQ